MGNSIPSEKDQADLSFAHRRLPGGSAANVVKGLAGLSGAARRVALLGMLGRDAAGAEYKQKLAAQGVDTSLLLETDSGAATASCLCLVRVAGGGRRPARGACRWANPGAACSRI